MAQVVLPWNFLTGHIAYLATIMSTVPRDIHSQLIPEAIKAKRPDLPPVFYLDSWPFGIQILVLSTPETCYQVTQEHSLPKFEFLAEFMQPLSGGNDLVSLEGHEWKRWRNIFNPGFSTNHMMTLVPSIVQETLVFCEILREHAAKGDMFLLEEAATRLTVDIITKITLDCELNSQCGDQINPFKRWNPLRPWYQRHYTRVLDRFIDRELEERYTAYKNFSGDVKAKRNKSVISLALDAYEAEQGHSKSAKDLDPTFKNFARSQIKTFSFAGHDTTSSTTSYIYYLLSKNPECLAKLRAEHDAVFGPDLRTVGAQISANPHLLNKLPYTIGVTKEALRLFPPASTIRAGENNFYVKHDGKLWPTEGMMVWAIIQTLHRDPNYWPEPSKFMPERWMVPEGDPLYPIKGAWRPFEFGPRNCIGQELANLELRLILAMTAREFDVIPDFAEWDRQHPRKGVNHFYGERAYQILVGSAKPVDGMPSRVKLRTNK
ncbi:MAG: hypothetical protein MMC33_008795 [Icmadophila ericetorum]|nr:hypothetical protein [Icmadophila ericetorum]